MAVNASLDHLVLAGTDLSALAAWWHMSSGTPPESGGAHTGLGTRNALVGLGGASYLELVGPDPKQEEPPTARPFGIDEMEPNSFRLVTLALAVDDLEAAVSAVKSSGIDPGPIRDMSRMRPDGVNLRWRLAVPPTPSLGGVMPFLIQWGSDTPAPRSIAGRQHPPQESGTGPPGPRFDPGRSLRIGVRPRSSRN